ncbi:MAG: GntR family transcriptional regulator [Acidobacteria bacterium]|nr:GntR family transcriptional regulator [Acidobacteriota bacterium]MCB9396321.1 GntR family transcriptional regulator [Acidobacteriota bacterium]
MYLQIIEQIKQKVAIGDWPAGQKLPSIRALAVELNVSVITVKRAYTELEREGVILTHQGKESVIADKPGLNREPILQDLEAAMERVIYLSRLLGISPEQIQRQLIKKWNPEMEEVP